MPTSPDVYEPRKSPPTPREHWTFLGRETHYGFTYLIWTLTAYPRTPNRLGTRWVRVVK